MLTLILGWCLLRVEAKDREQWIADIEAPLIAPDGTVPEATPAQVEAEGEAFMGLMAMAKGGLPGAATSG